jgi:hypothetical protein
MSSAGRGGLEAGLGLDGEQSREPVGGTIGTGLTGTLGRHPHYRVGLDVLLVHIQAYRTVRTLY